MSHLAAARAALLTAAATLGLAACVGGGGGQVSSANPCAVDGDPNQMLAQGWTAEERDCWSAATQGSRLMPRAWLKALEQPGSAAPFMDDRYLASFGLLPQSNGRMPVGFAVDESSDTNLTVSKLRWFDGQKDKEQWVGLNCSACHTGQLSYGGKDYRVDGGPSLFDYQSFVEAVDKALIETLESANSSDAGASARFDRFARKVFCPDQATAQQCDRDTAPNRALLKDALGRLVAWEQKVEDMNATGSRYGKGRVDAFGHIFNKVSLFNGAPNPKPNPASAPVSYPYIWDIYRHDKLQYNGIAQNSRLPLGGGRFFDYGAMGRNAGEVIGVFGDIAVVSPNPGLAGYKSSVDAANLERMERLLTKLKPLPWPAEFPKSASTPAEEQALLASGRALFAAHCESCHKPEPGTAPYKIRTFPLSREDHNSTDPWMACNAIRYKSPPGNLVGVSEDYIGSANPYTTEPAPIASMLTTTVKGALIGKKGQILAQAGRVFLGVGGLPEVRGEESILNPALQACYDSNNPLFAYKSRPLDGIWATAPYLHNGSVPNLFELLLPPEKRSTSFPVGTRLFDPKLVGYSTDRNAPGNGFVFDTSLAGNSNAGHDYGASRLTDADRWALIAYLKTL